MTAYTVDLYEPTRTGVNADSLAYTADNSTWPTADGGLLTASDVLDGLTNVVTADVYEPIHPGPGADTVDYTADNENWPTADGGVLVGATDDSDSLVIPAGAAILDEPAAAADALDAEVIPAAVVGEPGGGYYRRQRPFPVEGFGDGLLPELEGEALGAVGVIGGGQGKIGISGAGTGTTGVAGRSAGQIVIRATAIGQRGQVGSADVVLKSLSVSGHGVVAVRGAGASVITFKASAIGRHDDDEAAIMTILLAA
jgi:hypothetical protein